MVISIIFKLKSCLITLIFLFLLFLDAPEVITFFHVIPDGLHHLPRLLAHERSSSVNSHFAKIKKLQDIYPPLFDKQKIRSDYKISDNKIIDIAKNLLSYRIGIDAFHTGVVKKPYFCWESHNNNSQTSIYAPLMVKTLEKLTHILMPISIPTQLPNLSSLRI